MSNYGGLKQFGTYIFQYIVNFDTTFMQSRMVAQSVPGISGTFNHEGRASAPSGAGRVSISFVLVADDRADMDVQRDAVRALYEVGLQKLIYQPTDTTDDERWCLARVDTISINEDKSAHTDLQQLVQIRFVVPSPFWESAAYASYTLDDGKDLSDGLTLGDGALVVSASGVLTTTTLTNNGNAPAWLKVALTCGVGQNCTRPRIQRLQGAAIADEVTYNGLMSAGDEWFVDGRRQFVQLNGRSIFGGLFKYKRIELLQLMPGANTVNIRFDNVGEAASARFWFNHTWR